MRKRQWKKILSVVLALAMVFSMNITAFADEVADPAAAVEETTTEQPVVETPVESNEETPKEETNEEPAAPAEESAPAESEEEAPVEETPIVAEEAAGAGEVERFLSDWAITGGEEPKLEGGYITLSNDTTALTLKADGELSQDGIQLKTGTNAVTLKPAEDNGVGVAVESIDGEGEPDFILCTETSTGIALEASKEYMLYIVPRDGDFEVDYDTETIVSNNVAIITGKINATTGKLEGEGLEKADGKFAVKDIVSNDAVRVLVEPDDQHEDFNYVYWDLPVRVSAPPAAPGEKDAASDIYTLKVTVAAANNEYIVTDEEGHTVSEGVAETTDLSIVPKNPFVPGAKYYVRQRKPGVADTSFASLWSPSRMVKFADTGRTGVKKLNVEVQQITDKTAQIKENDKYSTNPYKYATVSDGKIPKVGDAAWKDATGINAGNINMSGLLPGTTYDIYMISGNAGGSSEIEEPAGAASYTSWSDPWKAGSFKTVGTYSTKLVPVAANLGMKDGRTFAQLFTAELYADGVKVDGDKYKSTSILTAGSLISENGAAGSDEITLGNTLADEYGAHHVKYGKNVIVLSGDTVKTTLGAVNDVADSKAEITISKSKVAVSVGSVELADDTNKTGAIKSLTFKLWDLENKGWLAGGPYTVVSADKAYSSFTVDGAALVSTNALTAGKHIVKASVSAGIMDITGVAAAIGDDYELCDPTTTDPGQVVIVSLGKDDTIAISLAPGEVQYGEGVAKGDAAADHTNKLFGTALTINGGAQELKSLASLNYYFTTSSDAIAKLPSVSEDDTSWNIGDDKYAKDLYGYKAGDKVYVVAKAVYGYGSNMKYVYASAQTEIKPRDIKLSVTDTTNFKFKRNKRDADKLSSNSLTNVYASLAVDGAHYSGISLATITNILMVSNNLAFKVNDSIVDYSKPGWYTPSVTDYTFTKEADGNFNVTSAILYSLIVTPNYYATFILNDEGKTTTVSVAEIAQEGVNAGKVIDAWPDAAKYSVSADKLVKLPKKIVKWRPVAAGGEYDDDDDITSLDEYIGTGCDYTVYAVVQAPATENGDIVVNSISPVIFDGRAHVASGSISSKNEKEYYTKRKAKADDLVIEVYDRSKNSSQRLAPGTDYTISYKNNKNASVYYTATGETKQMFEGDKRPYVQIKGKGNYKKLDIKVYYDILPNNLYEDDYTSEWEMSQPVLSGLKNVYVLPKNKTTTKISYKVTTTMKDRGGYNLTKKITLKAAKASTKSATGFTGDYKGLIYKYAKENNGWTLQSDGKVNGAGDYLLVLEGINNYTDIFTNDKNGNPYNGNVTYITNEATDYITNKYEFKVVDNTGVDASKASLKVKKKTVQWSKDGVSVNDFGPSLVYKGKTIKADFVLVDYGKAVTKDAGSYTIEARPTEAGFYGVKTLKVTVKGQNLKKNQFTQKYSEDGKNFKAYTSKGVAYRNGGYDFTVSAASLSADYHFARQSSKGADDPILFAVSPATRTYYVYGRGEYATSKPVKFTFKINKGKLADVIDKTVSVAAVTTTLNVDGTYPDIIISANGKTGENATKLTWHGEDGQYEVDYTYWDTVYDPDEDEYVNVLKHRTYRTTPKNGSFSAGTYGYDDWVWHSYTFKLTKNKAAGTGTLTITAGDYNGKATKTFKIDPVKLSANAVINDISEGYDYGDIVSEVVDVKANTNGKYSPKFTLYQVGTKNVLKTLKNKKDYAPTFNLVSENGANTVSVNSGTGANFKFEKNASDSKWYIYNNAAKKVTITVSSDAYTTATGNTKRKFVDPNGGEGKVVKVEQDDKGKISTTYCGGKTVCPKVISIDVDGTTYKLEDDAYTVAVTNNRYVGTGKITVKLQPHVVSGNQIYEFGGSKTFNFKINPAVGEKVIMAE